MKTNLFIVLLVFGVVSFVASRVLPIPVGEAKFYWSLACGMGSYDDEGGIFPEQDGWYFYYFNDHHGREVYKVSQKALLESVQDVYSALKKERQAGYTYDSKLASNRSKSTHKCLTAMDESAEQSEKFLDIVANTPLPSDDPYYDLINVESFKAQWSRAKLFWATILFETLFLSFWIIFTFRKGSLGKFNDRLSLRIALSPLLLFFPFYLGYAPFTFTYGPSGGLVYPLLLIFIFVVSQPVFGFPYNSLDLWILQNIPQLLSPITQIPVAMYAISFYGGMSPTVLIVFAIVVLLAGQLLKVLKARQTKAPE